MNKYSVLKRNGNFLNGLLLHIPKYMKIVKNVRETLGEIT